MFEMASADKTSSHQNEIFFFAGRCRAGNGRIGTAQTAGPPGATRLGYDAHVVTHPERRKVAIGSSESSHWSCNFSESWRAVWDLSSSLLALAQHLDSALRFSLLSHKHCIQDFKRK
jgi:hypothetical protein